MFLEVEHDHCETVLAALKLSLSSNICDKICIVCESGEQLCTSLSFLSLFSKLITSITHRSQEDPPQLIFVPLALTSVENLMILLAEGKLISEDLDSLKNVFEAAKAFDIESTSWSIEIEEKNRQTPPGPLQLGENCDSVLIRTISEPLPSYEFPALAWEDCEVGEGGDVMNNSLLGDLQAKTEFLVLGQNLSDENGNLGTRLPKKRGRPKKNKRGGGRPKNVINVDHSHKKSCKGGLKYPRGSCDFQTVQKGNLYQHQKSIHEGRFSCSFCDYQASQKGNLQKHKISVHEGKKFKCESCDYLATQKGLVKEHQMAVHQGIRYPCDSCKYQATRKRNLVLHQKSVHDGISYPCELCDKQFSQKSNLVSHHKAVHFKIKFPCWFCDYQATQKGNLDAHMKAIHQGITHPCASCDYQATTKQDLTRHQQSIHEKMKYPCVKCSYKASQRGSLAKHYVTRHK